jgi:hypothetical protein
MLLLTANQFAKRGSEFASGADVAVDESIRDRNRAWAEEQFETAEFFRYLASHLPSLLESQRDGERWRKRFAKLMEACGADISFNIDRDIEAMAKDLRAARVSAPASPPIAPGERP